MNELTVIRNPRGNQQAAMEMCDLIVSRARELEATAEATESAITAENWNDPQTKAAVEDLADAVEDLRTSGKKLVKAVVEETEAKRVLTAIDSRLWSYSSKADPTSAYGKLSAALKRIKAKVDGFNEASRPQEPPRAWVVRMDMNGDQFTAMAKAAEKAGCPFQVFATPQSDKATKQIQKWFEENI